MADLPAPLNLVASVDFFALLRNTIEQQLGNRFGSDNWDDLRFGPYVPNYAFAAMPSAIKPLLPGSNDPLQVSPLPNDQDELRAPFGQHAEGLARTYSLLGDAFSRTALLQLMSYRFLGHRHVKLWTNNAAYAKARQVAESLPSQNEKVATGIEGLLLATTDLSPIGYPMRLLTHPLVIIQQYIFCQYAYRHHVPPIRVEQGDCVIDAGAGWGDTALRFAHDAGETGTVQAFEFEPQNLEILAQNLALNPDLAARISIQQKALGQSHDVELCYLSMGPGTRIVPCTPGKKQRRVTATSIDQVAKTLAKVDFIKMDIEGSELSALRGAEQTIRQHRPKLAISVYHNLVDFITVPAYIDSLDVNYAYYIDHATIHSEETVFFAAPRDRSPLSSLEPLP